MDNSVEEAMEHQETVLNSENDFWSRLNAAYNSNERTGDFQADFYWPTKDRRLPESDMVVEIIGTKIYTESDQPRLHLHLQLPTMNKTAIKSCRLAPESMRFLRMDMERVGIRVDDLRKLGDGLKTLLNRPIKAHLYLNERTGWQDMDFMGLVATDTRPAPAPLETEAPIEPPEVDWGFSRPDKEN